MEMFSGRVRRARRTEERAGEGSEAWPTVEALERSITGDSGCMDM